MAENEQNNSQQKPQNDPPPPKPEGPPNEFIKEDGPKLTVRDNKETS